MSCRCAVALLVTCAVAMGVGCEQRSTPNVSDAGADSALDGAVDAGLDGDPYRPLIDGSADAPPAPDAAWPAGFQPTAANIPSGYLCDIPADYVEQGGDPVNPPCVFEVDHLSDRDRSDVPPQLEIVTWNVEFGKDTAGVIAALQSEALLADADILLMQEVPRGDGASDPVGVNLAREIAQKLAYNYIFAVEWDRRLDGGGGGEHGFATLSKYPIGNAKLIRHTPATDTYKEKKHFGGRATLAVDLAIGQRRVRVYNSHLATRDVTGNERAVQGAEIRQDADRSHQPPAQLLGGDLNTFLCNPTLFKCYEPPMAEKVIQEFLADGWVDLTPAYDGWTELGVGLFPQRLDWLFGRGVAPSTYEVLTAVRPADHVPVVALFDLLPQ